MTTTLQTQLRNATLTDLAAVLQKQQDAKIDVVVPANQVRADHGNLIVPGVETILQDDGVTAISGTLQPTGVCDETIAKRYSIPVTYLRAVRETGIVVPAHNEPLLDSMFNAHLAADPKAALVRGFKGEDGEVGIARALLSDRFKVIDHLDALMSVLDGARTAAAHIEVAKIDLSERFMRVHFVAPEITALAPTLLNGYRPPKGVEPYGTVDGRPIVFAGLVASNSETGGGAFSITPRFIVQLCSNGLVRTKDAVRHVHLGGKLDEGVVEWSEGTLRTNLELIARQTADAVSTFLNVDYMTRVLGEIEAQADQEINKPEETIKIVAQKLRYSEAEREGLFAHFIQGGQTTAGGLLNAVTSYAQEVVDPDRAAEIEASALDAMALVA